MRDEDRKDAAAEAELQRETEKGIMTGLAELKQASQKLDKAEGKA